MPARALTMQKARLTWKRARTLSWSSPQAAEPPRRLAPSPEPIISFDCGGSELAQGAVAMLLGKTSLPLSCRPQGCWDGEPTALRLDQFTFKLKLKTYHHVIIAGSCIIRVCMCTGYTEHPRRLSSFFFLNAHLLHFNIRVENISVSKKEKRKKKSQ